MGTIDDSIEGAVEFIFFQRQKNGLWRNFLTRTHGESTDWVSSYVGLNLLKSGVEKSELKITAGAVSEKQRENGGFSYNQKIIPDSDSTAFAIMFLSNFGYETEVGQARDFLLGHKNTDGSFSTYLPESIKKYYRIEPQMSVDGWCSGVGDITATALQALGNDSEALAYLKKSQQKEGFWRSYWWNSAIYATVHAILAIKGHDADAEVEKAQRWLAEQEIIPAVPFYIALSIQGIISNPGYSDGVESRISILLESQQDDGSWASYPILRFPHPSNTDPWANPIIWREEAKDQNRVFTTATCLRALSQYKQECV